METSVISEVSLQQAVETLQGLLERIVEASIEYFNTMNEGITYHTFKVTYQMK